jgi:hypothetical protein
MGTVDSFYTYLQIIFFFFRLHLTSFPPSKYQGLEVGLNVIQKMSKEYAEAKKLAIGGTLFFLTYVYV